MHAAEARVWTETEREALRETQSQLRDLQDTIQKMINQWRSGFKSAKIQKRILRLMQKRKRGQIVQDIIDWQHTQTRGGLTLFYNKEGRRFYTRPQPIVAEDITHLKAFNIQFAMVCLLIGEAKDLIDSQPLVPTIVDEKRES